MGSRALSERVRLWVEAQALAFACALTWLAGSSGAVRAQEVAAPPEAAAIEVHVKAKPNAAQQLQQSAEAVNVVDTRAAKARAADLGEVLARTQGVNVRREGGLGSTASFALNGLQGDQVRFFVDGIPLDYAGYPFGIVDLPVSLVEQVEVYRGVVPIRFGADALGGAVNVVTDSGRRNQLGGSYQVGSFGTHRLAATGQYVVEPLGFVARGMAFLDVAKNDYWVDVEATDEDGRLRPARVKRFHDGYRAGGGSVEVGVLDKPWARKLLVRGFAATADKALQHNHVMTVPYGEVTQGTSVYGSTLRYEVDLAPQLELQVVGSYARRVIDYSDQAKWVYDWFGERVNPRERGAELDSFAAHDQTLWQDNVFGRATAIWRVAEGHTVRAVVTPELNARTGDERIQDDPRVQDPLTAERELLKVVSGLEYAVELLEDQLAGSVFVKDYIYRARTEEPLRGGEVFRRHDRDSHTLGGGAALRLRLRDWLIAKASYEYATRLPNPDELFGDAVRVLPSLELEPEQSHNGNLGVRVDAKDATSGQLIIDVNVFIRQSDRLIMPLARERFTTFENLYEARGLGVENAVSYVAPRQYGKLDATLTWQDIRNDASAGPYAQFAGDRIPNRPYVFASWAASLRFQGVLLAQDRIEPFYIGRYVHEFYRGWESEGNPEFKTTVDSQLVHSVGVTWTFTGESGYRLAGTLEVDNLADARVYDTFGAQRPGRAFFLKVVGEVY